MQSDSRRQAARWMEAVTVDYQGAESVQGQRDFFEAPEQERRDSLDWPHREEATHPLLSPPQIHLTKCLAQEPSTCLNRSNCWASVCR